MNIVQIRRLIGPFWSEEGGVTAIEYALLGALIAVVITSSVAILGQSVLGLFKEVVAAFP